MIPAPPFRSTNGLCPELPYLVDGFVDVMSVVCNEFRIGHATGTMPGAPFLGIEATGRRLDFRGVDVIHLDAAGKVDTNTVYYDGAEFARQVGMLPRRDSALDRLSLAGLNAVTRLRKRMARR